MIWSVCDGARKNEEGKIVFSLKGSSIFVGSSEISIVLDSDYWVENVNAHLMDKERLMWAGSSSSCFRPIHEIKGSDGFCQKRFDVRGNPILKEPRYHVKFFHCRCVGQITEHPNITDDPLKCISRSKIETCRNVKSRVHPSPQ